MGQPRRLTDYCKRCGGDLIVTGAHFRFYCPSCGEVRCGYRRHGKMIVAPHYKHDKRGHGVPCLGGEVDEREDRAP